MGNPSTGRFVLAATVIGVAAVWVVASQHLVEPTAVAPSDRAATPARHETHRKLDPAALNLVLSAHGEAAMPVTADEIDVAAVSRDARAALQGGRIADAIDPLRLLVAADSANPTRWRDLARTEQQLGNIEPAIALYLESLKRDAEQPGIRYELATLYLTRPGKRSDAEREAKLALASSSLDPTHRKRLLAMFPALAPQPAPSR